MEIIPIVPKSVYKFHHNYNDSLQQCVDDASVEWFQHGSPNVPSNQTIDLDNVPQVFKDAIITNMRTVLDYERLYYENLFISLIWLNVHNKDVVNSHGFHYHQNSLFSGVYYFQVVENDGITFIDNDRVFQQYYDIIRKDTGEHYNTTETTITVNQGDMLFFRSDYEHGVKSFKSGMTTRKSIAFNIMLDGIGNTERLTWMKKM